MQKLVIIINGPGGVGKDTLCEFAAKKYRVQNISSITPIKQIATAGGWHNEKTLAARKLLSDIKLAFVEYNDLPTQYCADQYEQFLQGENELLFVHIREGAEIEKLVKRLHTPCITLLVLASRVAAGAYGNTSDDMVTDYTYDYTYHNNQPLELAEADFLAFLDEIVQQKSAML